MSITYPPRMVDMPDGYAMHFDSQLGYWWASEGMTSRMFRTAYACRMSAASDAATRAAQHRQLNQIPSDVPAPITGKMVAPGSLVSQLGYEQALAAMLEARRARKLHIRGPLVGGLWLCRLPSKPDRTASGLSPEGAYTAWYSYWGAKP